MHFQKNYVTITELSRRTPPLRYAAVAQLDRVTGYEPVGRGFESLQPYQIEKIRTCLPLATGSGFSFPCMKQHNPVNRRRRYLHDTAAAFLLGGLAENRGASELEAFPFLLKFRNLLKFSKPWKPLPFFSRRVSGTTLLLKNAVALLQNKPIYGHKNSASAFC